MESLLVCMCARVRVHVCLASDKTLCACVRVCTCSRGVFSRGFTQQFSREDFIVSKRLYKKRAEYEIKDQTGEDILGRFYEVY